MTVVLRYVLLLVSFIASCAPSGTPVSWPPTDAPLVALLLVDDGDRILGAHLAPLEGLSTGYALQSGQRMLYAPLDDELVRTRAAADGSRFDEASLVECRPECDETVDHARPGFVDLHLSDVVTEVHVLEHESARFVRRDDPSPTLPICVRFAERASGCASPLAKTAPFAPDHPFLPDGVVIAGEARRWANPDHRSWYFELSRVTRLDADHVVAMARQGVYWLTRGRSFADSARDFVPHAPGSFFSGIAREPNRRPDGTWRVAASRRLGGSGNSEAPGVIVELVIDDRGILESQERYRNEEKGIEDMAWIEGVGLVAVGKSGLIVTATSASGPWRTTEALTPEEDINRVVGVPTPDALMVLATRSGSVVVVESLFPLRALQWPTAPGNDFSALTVEVRDGRLIYWVGTVQGRLFRVEAGANGKQNVELVPVTVDAADTACGSGLTSCGRRIMGYRFRDLHWMPGEDGGHLLGITPCPGVIWFRPDGCGTSRARDGSLPSGYGLFRAHVEDTRITVAGAPGEILELTR